MLHTGRKKQRTKHQIKFYVWLDYNVKQGKLSFKKRNINVKPSFQLFGQKTITFNELSVTLEV